MQMRIFLPGTVLLLLTLLFGTGCIGQREQEVQGEFLFEDTGLVLQLPEDWRAVSIPGSQWPLLATEIDYGIRPNIRLLKHSKTPFLAKDVDEFLVQEQETDTDYRILSEQGFEVDGFSDGMKITATRKNADNIPVVHLSYILLGERGSYILYATCAEPSLEATEPLFDDIIRTARVRK